MFFFFNDTATTEIYTLSLHDALPIFPGRMLQRLLFQLADLQRQFVQGRLVIFDNRVEQRMRHPVRRPRRSEEHTSELQSQSNLVCRLLLEKKNKTMSDRDRGCAYPYR